MTRLTDIGHQMVADLSARHGFDPDAVTHMLLAVYSGGGSQAQFSHPAFGGMGQWSQGGMTMIGDMFNNGLKAQVDALCADLAQALSQQTLVAPPPAMSVSFQGMGGALGWPTELGHPASQGSQNNLRYAFFPEKRRLAIADGGRVQVFDTGQHQISGFGQAQGGAQTLTFSSQFGMVDVGSLPRIEDSAAAPVAAPPMGEAPAPAARVATEPTAPTMAQMPEAAPEGLPEAAPDAVPGAPPSPAAPMPAASQGEALIAQIEALAGLRDRGILTDEEFQAKKTELLARL